MGGRLLQFGDESRSEDVAGCVAKHRIPAPGEGAAAAAGRRLAAAASGRRREGRRRDDDAAAAAAESGESAARERRSARDAIAMAAAKP